MTITVVDTFTIDKPGEYVTRDGRRVTVHEISTARVTFPVKGAIWRTRRGKSGPHGFALWTAAGSYWTVDESKDDIVGPWMGEI